MDLHHTAEDFQIASVKIGARSNRCENRLTLTHARMAKDLPAGNHAKGDAREAQGNFHMAVPRVFS